MLSNWWRILIEKRLGFKFLARLFSGVSSVPLHQVYADILTAQYSVTEMAIKKDQHNLMHSD